MERLGVEVNWRGSIFGLLRNLKKVSVVGVLWVKKRGMRGDIREIGEAV